MTNTPQDLIRELGLEPHAEGGYFRETYRAATCDASGRAASTLIYFLLLRGQVSRLHRIDADEGWHLYLGGPLLIHELDERAPAAAPHTMILGADVARGERPQHIVLAGRWFGAELEPQADFALVGCSVAPAFEFQTFELADRTALRTRFTGATALIERLT
jgi:predicted cupin superfamily sugar epimerase